MPYAEHHSKEKLAEYYQDNKQKISDWKRQYDRDVQKWVREFVKRFKLKVGCTNCGYKKYHKALEFHHKDPTQKDIHVSELVAKVRSKRQLYKLKNEIRKCVVLCANCHREEHGKHD